ncbi:hypothetical protein BCV70DRAFT_197955 [Testicularia cyperi]|uniref:RINT-1 family protein n=1 Tax=Testicularia cyperi TaxID=1882483 RepID=A0A317Y0U3_9BASI|nr:hypothetical protein BCV70DRAFT_197955 [Testicularia cyperi]
MDPRHSLRGLEPHELGALLQGPTDSERFEHVVEHLNFVLPQLAATNEAGASPRVSPFSCLPSSDVLKTHLEKLKAAQQQASSRTAELESQLRERLLQNLAGVKLLRERLSSLPDEIASTEDKLLDLCEDLVVSDAAQSRPESSKSGPTTLMKQLEQLHDAIEQLQKAKSYFSLLSQAEDLRVRAQKQDQETEPTEREAALQSLAELDALVKQTERLAAKEESEPKFVSFLRAQRSAAFKALKRGRSTRLAEALSKAGWTGLPSKSKTDLDSAVTASNGHPNNESNTSFVGDADVRQCWSELCQLQDAAEHLGLLRRATAKARARDVSERKTAKHTSSFNASTKLTAGSDGYQPLLATQILVEPLLLRFRYHFDGDRATNRLDKPEWYLSHIAALIQSHSALFRPAVHGIPGSGGVVVRLCRQYANASPQLEIRRAYRHIDTYAELLHGLLTPLRRKLASSVPSLLDNPSLLAHTVFQALTFDAELEEKFPPCLTVLEGQGTYRVADDILANKEWFTRWLEGEKEFALRRFDNIMDAPDAWALGSSDSLADDDQQVFYSAGDARNDASNGDASHLERRTTKSARSVIDILEAVSERYKPLPSLSQRLSFLAIVQLPILRSYAVRLTKSLDAFESLSSAFARAMPGEIVAVAGVANPTSDSDMVKGLRGLGRLVKALLSAQYVCSELERWSESVFFVEMSEELHSTEEGRQLALGLRRDEASEQDRELDAASLGMLLRRGLKRGAAVARPLASDSRRQASSPTRESGSAGVGTPQLSDVGKTQILNEFGRYGVWEEPMHKFKEIAKRATNSIERLVISEILEQLRPYMLRRWDEEHPSANGSSSAATDAESIAGDEPEQEAIPTPSLIAALSMFSTHLGHLVTVLDGETLLPIYRHVAGSLSQALVDRVVMSGGSRRFSYSGGCRFRQDLEQGWLGVVSDILSSGSASSNRHMLGRRPEAPWKLARDVATLLSLPSTSSTSKADEGTVASTVPLAKAVQIAFDQPNSQTYVDLLTALGNIDDKKVNVREVLRRRVEVWK